LTPTYATHSTKPTTHTSPNAPKPHPTAIFFFNDTATTELYTLSLHDALPISSHCSILLQCSHMGLPGITGLPQSHSRSEEHMSELQSRLHLVCRLLLEKK